MKRSPPRRRVSAAPEVPRELDATFAALADGTRRGVVALLRTAPRRAGELAEQLGMRPPAMSRHLRILQESGIIEEAPQDGDARVRMFRLRRAPFGELRTWLDDVETFWTAQLTAFAQHVERRTARTTTSSPAPRRGRRA